MLLERSYPSSTRQVLRKLGVERITVTPVTPNGDDWTSEGLADVGPQLNTGLTPSGGGC
jgi:hypothetical protein